MAIWLTGIRPLPILRRWRWANGTRERATCSTPTSPASRSLPFLLSSPHVVWSYAPPRPIRRPAGYSVETPGDNRMVNSIWVDLLGAQVHYEGTKYRTRVIEYGDGVPLILLHGGGGHAEAYSRNVVRLGGHFRAMAMDMVWHGLS